MLNKALAPMQRIHAERMTSFGCRNFAAAAMGARLDENGEPRFLEQVELFFNRAASRTNVPKDYLDMIKICDNVIRFAIPIKRDNGQME